MKSYEITTKPRDLPVGWRTIDFAWWIQEQNRGNCGPRTHRCQPIPPMARTGRCGSSFSKQLVFSSNALNMCYHQDLLGLRHKMVSACFSWWIMRRSHTPLLIPDASVDRAKSFFSISSSSTRCVLSGRCFEELTDTTFPLNPLKSSVTHPIMSFW